MGSLIIGIVLVASYVILVVFNFAGAQGAAEEGNSGIVFMTFASILVSKGLLLTSLVLLMLIITAIKDKEPFKTHILKRFYFVGFLILIQPILNWFTMVVMVGNRDIFQFLAFDQELLLFESVISRFSMFLILGCLILSFAYVLDQGAKIYEEQKLTV